MSPELSIHNIEPTGALSCVQFENGHRWTMVFINVRVALVNAVLLGMVDDLAPYLEEYRSKPNDCNLFTLLPDYFEEDVLKRHGWKLESNPKWVM